MIIPESAVEKVFLSELVATVEDGCMLHLWARQISITSTRCQAEDRGIGCYSRKRAIPYCILWNHDPVGLSSLAMGRMVF
jgi:hypothetical protein